MATADSEVQGTRKVAAASADAAGRRLDQWLAAVFAGDLSRSRLQTLIREGSLRLNGDPVSDPGRKVREGDLAELDVPDAAPARPAGEAIPLTILHEDGDVIVIDKPAGLVVHPGAGNGDGTLVNALIHHCGGSLSGIGGVRRPGIVHRLDKETSGVMVVAKNDRSHRALSTQFAEHGRDGKLERAYLALVWGVPPARQGVVDAPLGRAADRVRRAVVRADHPDARHAVTHWRLVEAFGDAASLVECRLETGRTHQIRVHMAHLGFPLVGDADYGRAFRTKANRLPEPLRPVAAGFPRQALHAHRLAFVHPATGQRMAFTTGLPDDMRALVDAFRGAFG